MKTFFPSLNGLRGVSVIIVILFHLSIQNHFIVFFPLSLIWNGFLGVNIFFVISGFLITKLLLSEEKRNGTISIKNFYIRRTFRIFPAYYFLLLVYFVLQLLSIVRFPAISWITSLTYTKYFHLTEEETNHFWSLSVEENFYLIFPFVFKFLPNWRKAFAYALIIIPILVRALTYKYSIPYLSVPVSIFQRVDAIMIGCLLALYYLEVDKFLLFKKNRLAYIAIFCSALKISIKFFIAYSQKNGFGYNIFVMFFVGISDTLINVLICVLLYYSICKSNTLWFKFLNNPIMNYLGKLSYSLYLWQQIFILGSIGFFSRIPFNVLFIFIAALFSYYFIEKPFLRLKKRFEE